MNNDSLPVKVDLVGDLIPASDLSAILEKLPKEKRDALLAKVAENHIDLTADTQQKIALSKIAHHDLALALQAASVTSQHNVTGQFNTGSGKIELKAKGFGLW